MLKKEKILISLVIITLMVLVFGSISSLATELTATNATQNKITIQAASSNNTAANNSTNTNTNTNSATISGTVNAVGNSTNKTNTSNYNSTTNSTKLPYAGTNSSVVFIVIGFAASALYAYKKVSDYNV